MNDKNISGDGFVSFTVPASGRRYNINLDDWASIQIHMGIAAAVIADPKHNPPVSTRQ